MPGGSKLDAQLSPSQASTNTSTARSPSSTNLPTNSSTTLPDAKAELLKLNQLLLVLFLELLSVLVEQPTAYAETLTRLIAALQNMQHLVNLLRPQQASPRATAHSQ